MKLFDDFKFKNEASILIFAVLIVEIILPIVDTLFNDYWDLVNIHDLSVGVLLGGVVYFALFGFTLFLLAAVLKGLSFGKKLRDFLDSIYLSHGKTSLLFSVLLVLLIFNLLCIVFVEQPLPDNLDIRLIYYVLGWFHLSLYLFLFISVVAILALVVDLYHFRQSDKNIQQDQGVSSVFRFVGVFAACLVIFVLFLYLMFAFYLLFSEIPFITFIKFWFFKYRAEITPYPVLGVMVALVIIFTVIFFIIRIKKTARWKYVLLLVVGVALQFFFPLFEDGNLARIEYTVTHFGSASYIETACTYECMGDLNAKFEDIVEVEEWLATKPVGYLAPYFGVKHLVGLAAPQVYRSEAVCVETLSIFLTYAAPVISLICLLPLFFVSKFIYPQGMRFLPVLVFILLPNTILFTGVADQMFLPIAFMVFVLLSVLVVEKRSYWMAAAAGAWYYVCLSYSFSLIGIIGFLFFLFVWKLLEDISWANFKELFLLGLVVVGTVLVIEVGMRLAADYNTLDQIQRSLTAHRTSIKLKGDRRNFLPNVLVANLEYILFIGPPTLILLFGGILYKLVVNRGSGERVKWQIVSAFLLFYVLLNFAGQNKGETARLWMFLNPMIALTAPMFIAEMDEKHQNWIFAGFIVIQLLLMFVFNHTFYNLFQNGVIEPGL